MIKRVLVIGAVAVGLIGVTGASAAADEPTVSEFTEIFDDVDPCTGETQTVTIYLEIREHLGHPNNFVATISETGFTSAGYVMLSGQVHFDANRNGEHFVIANTWVNPDTGDRFGAQVLVVFNARQGELKFDSARLQCLGAETVLSG